METIAYFAGSTVPIALLVFTGSYFGIWKKNSQKLPTWEVIALFFGLWVISAILVIIFRLVLYGQNELIQSDVGNFWGPLIIGIVIGRNITAWRRRVNAINPDSRNEVVSKFDKSAEAGFSDSIYPRYLKHLRSFGGRFLYSLLPFALLNVLVLALDGPEIYVRDFKEDPEEILLPGLGLTLVVFILLSILHVIITKLVPNWHNRKDLRLWCFGSFFWIVGAILFVIFFEPYGGSINGDELIEFFMVVFVPPLFVGSAMYVYEKFIA